MKRLVSAMANPEQSWALGISMNAYLAELLIGEPIGTKMSASLYKCVGVT